MNPGFVNLQDPMRHSFTLEAIPLDWLTEENLNDLSWLLGDDYVLNSYISLLILDPVLLVFKDTLTKLVIPSVLDTSWPIH